MVGEARLGADLGGRQVVEGGEIGGGTLGRVEPVAGLVVENVGPCGEPIKIAADGAVALGERQFQEGGAGELRQGPGIGAGLRAHPHGVALAVEGLPGQVRHQGMGHQVARGSEAVVDDADGAVEVGVLHVQRLVGALNAVEAGAGAQVVIVEVPDEGWPAVVEHPLDDAGGFALAAAEGLEHGALALVGAGLGLPDEVAQRRRRAIAGGEGGLIAVQVQEVAAAGVEVPVGIIGALAGAGAGP